MNRELHVLCVWEYARYEYAFILWEFSGSFPHIQFTPFYQWMFHIQEKMTYSSPIYKTFICLFKVISYLIWSLKRHTATKEFSPLSWTIVMMAAQPSCGYAIHSSSKYISLPALYQLVSRGSAGAYPPAQIEWKAVTIAWTGLQSISV